jgi:hypothetical protein
MTADTKDDDGSREVAAPRSGARHWLPEYSVVPSAGDRGSLRTASVEYLVEDEDVSPGTGSGPHDLRRPHTSATPGGRGGAGLRSGSAGVSNRMKGTQSGAEVRVFAAIDQEQRFGNG